MTIESKHRIEGIISKLTTVMNGTEGEQCWISLGAIDSGITIAISSPAPKWLAVGQSIVIGYRYLRHDAQGDFKPTLTLDSKGLTLSKSTPLNTLGECHHHVIRMQSRIDSVITNTRELKERAAMTIGFGGLTATILQIAPFYNVDTPIKVAFTTTKDTLLSGFYHVESNRKGVLSRIKNKLRSWFN